MEKNKILLVNKPYQWTSFDVVKYIRKALSKSQPCKVGHAGTLDPLATGLLLICTGNQTKNIANFTNLSKEYTGTFVLGATTPSYDLETEIDATYPTTHLSEDLILDQAKQMIGVFEQMPPIFSAKKVDGKIAYKQARAGKEIQLKPAKIEIIDFQITEIRAHEVDFKVHCSKGTYIRSLAYDFGKALHTGAYLKNLCRTKIGDFSLAEAFALPITSKSHSNYETF